MPEEELKKENISITTCIGNILNSNDTDDVFDGISSLDSYESDHSN